MKTTESDSSKWAVWVVLVAGGAFVLAVDVPLLLLGLLLGFVGGIITVWRNPWGVFRFMEPEIARAESLEQNAQSTGNGQHLTINVGQTNTAPEVLVTCKHCGAMVDIVKNPACPKCGAPMK